MRGPGQPHSMPRSSRWPLPPEKAHQWQQLQRAPGGGIFTHTHPAWGDSGPPSFQSPREAALDWTGILPESEGPRGAAVSGEGGAGFESLLQEPQAGARGWLTSAPLRASWHQSQPRCRTLACREGPSPWPGPPLSGLCSVQFLGGGGAPHSKTAPRPPRPRAPPPPWKRLLLTPRGS